MRDRQPFALLLAVVVVVVFAVASAGGGCAHLRKDQSVCPEYRSLRCAAGERCSMDRARGCKVCQCEPLEPTPGVDDNPDSNAFPPR